MSETKWTPGPWSAGALGEMTDDRRNGWTVVRKAGAKTLPAYSVAAIPLEADRHDANLALVLASPRLYAALDALVAKLDRLGTLDTPTMNEARAALRKARGEEG